MKILRYEDHLEERRGRSWLKRRERGLEETLAGRKGNLKVKIYSDILTLIFSQIDIIIAPNYNIPLL